MLTTDDRNEIKRLIAEAVGEVEKKRTIPDFDGPSLNVREPEEGDLPATLEPDSIVEVAARAVEVFGTREKALRWLKTPVRSLGGRTPLSLLNSPDGVARVQDTLGRVEHGVW